MGRSSTETRRPLFHGSVPLHHQIQRLLRAKIQSAEWRRGDRMPTEIEFSEQFRVSRTTIRQALRSLERDGLITRGRALGTFVSEPPVRDSRDVVIASPLMGYEAEVDVIDIGRVAAPNHVAEFLRLHRGEPVQRFLRVEYVDGLPLAVLFNYMHIELGKKITRSQLVRHSMLECISKHAKVPPARVHQSVEARMPDENVAPLLGIDLTEPTLFWQMRLSDEDGAPVQLCDMFYRADRCRYEMESPFSVTDRRATMTIPARRRHKRGDNARNAKPARKAKSETASRAKARRLTGKGK